MAPKPHSELPPVSREALEANLRSTHANLDACIEQRRRLEEQLETTERLREGYYVEAQQLREQLEVALGFLSNINEDADEALLRMRIDRAREALESSPASSPNVGDSDVGFGVVIDE